MENRDYYIGLLDSAYMISTKPSRKLLRSGTIIDENKSVEWNREQVIAENSKYHDEVTQLRDMKNNQIIEVQDKIIDEYIADGLDYSMSHMAMTVIFNQAYMLGHSGGANQIFNHLDELISFVNDLLKEVLG